MGINVANVVLPTLITQIDGVLTDNLNSKGLQWDSDYDNRVDTKTGKVRSIEFVILSPLTHVRVIRIENLIASGLIIEWTQHLGSNYPISNDKVSRLR
jgi:hypothetical protein